MTHAIKWPYWKGLKTTQSPSGTIRAILYWREVSLWRLYALVFFLLIPCGIAALPLVPDLTGADWNTSELPTYFGFPQEATPLLFVAPVALVLYWIASCPYRLMRRGLGKDLPGTSSFHAQTKVWREAWNSVEETHTLLMDRVRRGENNADLVDSVPSVPWLRWQLSDYSESPIPDLSLDPSADPDTALQTVRSRISEGLLRFGGDAVRVFKTGDSAVYAISMQGDTVQSWVIARPTVTGLTIGVTVMHGYCFWAHRGSLTNSYYWGDRADYKWGGLFRGGDGSVLSQWFFALLLFPLQMLLMLWQGLKEVFTRHAARAFLYENSPRSGESLDVTLIQNHRKPNSIAPEDATVQASRVFRQRASHAIQSAMQASSQPRSASASGGYARED